MHLSQAALTKLPKAIKRPSYDRSKLTAGILHIGVGNYHRAHQSWYLNRLFELGRCLDWAIVGAGVRSFDKNQREKLQSQDWLTTLVERDAEGIRAEIVGSMIDFVEIEDDNAALILRMAEPDIRIVSLTITEGGYYVDQATNQFNREHPDISHDAKSPNSPRTAFGAIVAALRLRRDKGLGPFTCLCCDNLQENGAVLRNTIVSLARLSDLQLADWIDTNCSFPNSMVDGVVPATGDDTFKLLSHLGVNDFAPVSHESYRHWVIEDDFCAGRPDLEHVGVIFSDRVHDYETMKIRVLNAGHQILANVGEILSLGTIADCMNHTQVHEFYQKTQRREIIPHVGHVPGMTPEQYLELVNIRFFNPEIADTTRRVAFDGSARHTGFVLPIIKDALAAGTPISGLALAEAFWARMCAGIREDGSEIVNNDPFWEELVTTATKAKADPMAWLDRQHVYGNLRNDPTFSNMFEGWLQKIWANGAQASLQAYCGE